MKNINTSLLYKQNMSQVMEQISDMKNIKKYLETLNLHTLKKTKKELDDIYYNTGEGRMANWKYDILCDVISKLDPDYVSGVGAKLRDGENKVELPFYLGSLDKVKLEDNNLLERWLSKHLSSSYIVSDKLDGISCLVVWNGNSYRLYTRGNGVEGADISNILPYINHLPRAPLRDTEKRLVVRGELLIPINTFEKKYKKKYANARNMVSGIVGAKTARKGLYDVDFVAYEIIRRATEQPKLSTQLKTLKEYGFRVVHHTVLEKVEMKVLEERLFFCKEKSIYEIDGLVVQGDIPYRRNRDKNPKYAFAFKMIGDDSTVDVVVEKVEWNASKHGVLKPRVRIQPVHLCGVKITYTTGFNAKYILENKIGPGAVIKITRSGDVIPFILEVIKPAKQPDMPVEQKYQWNKSRVDIVVEEVGKDTDVKVIVNFLKQLKIKYTSDATVSKLYDVGFKDIVSLVKAKAEDFTKADGVKIVSARKLYTNLHSGLQNISMGMLMGASSLFGIGMGRRKMEALMEAIPHLLQVHNKKDLITIITQVKGFSIKSAEKVVDNIDMFRVFLKEMQPYITFRKESKTSERNSSDESKGEEKLVGKTFVFSGFRDGILEERIESLGGKVSGSVSQKTSAVIVKDMSKDTGKTEKAKKYEIPIILKENFEKSLVE